MSSGEPSPQTAWMRRFVDGERCRFQATCRPVAGEFEFRPGFRCSLELEPDLRLERMSADFASWCARCLKVLPGDAAPGVTWRLARPLAEPVNPTDPERERFTIEVTGNGVVVEAHHVRGLLSGTHHLTWLLADRGAPALPVGRREYVPAFSSRIGNGIFIHGDQQLSDYDNFSDEYLALFTRYGNNGIHFHLRLAELWQSTSVPELNTADFAARTGRLREVCRRLAEFGIDLYVYLLSMPLRHDHPVFAADPRRRGALTDAAAFGSDRTHCLCLSSPAILRGYSEAVQAIYTAVPELAGAIVIVGGEGLMHCYTRPAPSPGGYTNCPQCRDTAPARPVAHLVNTIAAAVKTTGAHKPVFAWPYSAFTWSGEDRAQLEWIRELSADVYLQANFDTNFADPTTGSGASLYDYNIKSIGPSPVYAAQAQACREQGRPFFAKIESTTTPDAFFLPYLPLHQRWFGRFQAMRELGLRGAMIQWRFYGMNGSPPEELFYRATWEPERSAADVLQSIARRDFGLADGAGVVAGWELLSQAWDDFPYSALTAGERDYYMRGPFYLGPAHPLIFDPNKSYDLIPAFRTLQGAAFEQGIPDNLDELIRRAPPRYVSDLTLTMPFGIDRYLELTRRCRQRWEAGLALLRQHLGTLADSAGDLLAAQSSPAVRARLELDVVEAMGIHLATLEHTVEFYRLREELWQHPLSRPDFNARMERLAAVARLEIANAERALPILDRDPRIGYGHTYGQVYDRAMVADKLRQCRYVVDVELPDFSRLMRFHLWNDVTRTSL